MFNKKKIKFPIKSLDFGKILIVDIWLIKNLKKNEKKNLKEFLSQILRILKLCLFTYPKIKFSKSKKLSIFYIRLHARADLENHSQHYENIKDTTVCVMQKREKKFSLFNFLNCIYLCFLSRKQWFKELKDNNIDLLSYHGLEILLKLFNSLSDAIKIYPLLLKHVKLVSFQEMLPEENIICQLANINNIETYALEHAVATYENEGPTWRRWQKYIYFNPVCKNILCWGEFSKKLREKHTDAKACIIGKAGLPEFQKAETGVIFIFEWWLHEYTNKKLLKMSYDLAAKGIPVSRWFKPGNILIENSKLRDGPLRKIVIGNNSILTLDLAILGFEVYLIEDSNLKNYIPGSLLVNDIDKIIQIFQNKDSAKYPHNSWKYFIEFTGKEAVKRYQKIVLDDK